MHFVAVVLIALYLRKNFQTKTTMPLLDKRLFIGMIAAVGLLVASGISDTTAFDLVFDFIGNVILAALLYFIYTDENFKPARFLLTAALPFLIVSFLDTLLHIISKSLSAKWHSITDTASTFAVLWGIGVWFVTRRQQKELIKARAKALEEEKSNKITTAMKVELEVQVAERTAELTQQKEELQKALYELKDTQAQLIQSEKMASLGELTAGIAHEIQNPLNFVSNFSDVNNELLDEMLAEINNNNADEAKHIAGDIKENNSKIIFHGRRADAIVKGMLQHSRKHTGQKEATDINALCDEYLRLSYHGLRAKDKSFNADFKTYFDESIGKINIVSQDVGRVLLNLVNNAFYAVTDMRKSIESSGDNIEAYKPMITIQTKKIKMPAEHDGVEITVTDNGKGIPQNIIDKIFQPFFTTKPTGQGTGLGLSLAYDIITKEHNGTINVESTEGEGTKFVIQLPCT